MTLRAWIAVALLAGAWLFALPYYLPASAALCAVLIVVAALLLGQLDVPLPPRGARVAGAVLALAAAVAAPWPDRAVPIVLLVGLLLGCAALPRRWPRYVARGAISASAIFAAQGVALWAYAALTARSHDLPWPLPGGMAALLRVLGFSAAADGPYVVFATARQPHRLAATWEWLCDPVSLGFFVGGLVLLALGLLAMGATIGGAAPGGSSRVAAAAPAATWSNWRAWRAGAVRLGLVMLGYLPARAVLLAAIYVHRVVRFDYETPLAVMNHFFSPWLLTTLAIVPAWLAWRWTIAPRDGDDGLLSPASPPAPAASDSAATGGSLESAAAESTGPPAWLGGKAAVVAPVAALLGVAAALATLAVGWAPVGTRLAGRVRVVERHSTWEPTTRPYDTTWYGELAGYNYAAVYDYLGQYYAMSRLLESQPIDEKSLADCDVLVIKTPTERYSRQEVDAVERFVARGGGLLLIGDHTNVFDGGTILNDIARRLGFAYRHDQLLGFGRSPYDQHYRPERLAHPIVAHLPPMDFAVSCSIDPGWSLGRAAIRSTGLWSMPPEYHHENYMPVPQHVPEMRYGAFIQAWAIRHGEGRVVAFTDSTIFSNFCVFQPGKAELLRGMIEWLNHRGAWPAWPLPVAGALGALVGAVVVARRRQAKASLLETWSVLLAAALCGWAFGAAAAGALNRAAIGPPPLREEPKTGKPARLTKVVIDRELSAAPLSNGANTQGDGAGYGLLEQWVPRLGCFTQRAEGAEVFSGDMLLVITPSRAVTDAYRRALIDYIAAGGRLLVVDSPENPGTTSNSLLWPFGLSIPPDQAWKGNLRLAASWPGIEVERAWEVVGGEPVAWLGQRPVGAVARHGKGAVMALGFGSLFNDERMGGTWMLEPDPPTRTRYEALFTLLRRALEDRPVTAPLALPVPDPGKLLLDPDQRRAP